jgi:hypothetical protein
LLFNPERVLVFCYGVPINLKYKLRLQYATGKIYVIAASLRGVSGAFQVRVTIIFSALLTWVAVFCGSKILFAYCIYVKFN